MTSKSDLQIGSVPFFFFLLESLIFLLASLHCNVTFYFYLWNTGLVTWLVKPPTHNHPQKSILSLFAGIVLLWKQSFYLMVVLNSNFLFLPCKLKPLNVYHSKLFLMLAFQRKTSFLPHSMVFISVINLTFISCQNSNWKK